MDRRRFLICLGGLVAGTAVMATVGTAEAQTPSVSLALRVARLRRRRLRRQSRRMKKGRRRKG